MSLKDDIQEQKKYLVKNLKQLNTVVSAILGHKTELKIKEINQENKTYFRVADDRNIKEQCGIMAKSFKKVVIENFGMWWQENGVIMDLQFSYEHIDGGTNGVKFCTINIEDGLVKII